MGYRLRQVSFGGSLQRAPPINIPLPEPSVTLGLLAGVGSLSALATRRRYHPRC